MRTATITMSTTGAMLNASDVSDSTCDCAPPSVLLSGMALKIAETMNTPTASATAPRIIIENCPVTPWRRARRSSSRRVSPPVVCATACAPRSLDDWETQQASYPGSDMVERGIEVSAVGFVVGLVATIVTSGGVSLRPAMGLAMMVLVFLGLHYAAIEVERRGTLDDE